MITVSKMEELDKMKVKVQNETPGNETTWVDDGHKTEMESGRKSEKHRKGKEDKLLKELEASKLEYNTLHDKYIRLLSEFDNFRKRTIKERADLLKTAGEEVILSLLPVLDDMDRALRSSMDPKDPVAIREGIQLIMNKLSSTLAQKGLQPIEAIGKDFNTDFHEAITDIPAPSPDLKGKVIDETEKGYTLGGKVIRFSKVVVGK